MPAPTLAGWRAPKPACDNSSAAGRCAARSSEARTLSAMSAFPATRLRRLRRTDALRSLVREARLDLHDFVMPLFACPGEGVVRPVEGLDPIAQLSMDDVGVDAGQPVSLR